MTLIEWHVEQGVGWVKLNRPEKRNALSHDLVDEFEMVEARLAEEGATVAVISGSSPVFSAGNDLVEALADPDNAAAPRMIERLIASSLFWVAYVEHPALGAGVAMVAVCPLAICAEDAWFALPEREIGIFPAGITPYTEPLIGYRRSFSLGLSGERIPAPEAARIGLVDEAVPRDRLAERLEHWLHLLRADKQVTRSARRAWQERFELGHERERAAQLGQVLADQEIRASGTVLGGASQGGGR